MTCKLGDIKVWQKGLQVITLGGQQTQMKELVIFNNCVLHKTKYTHTKLAYKTLLLRKTMKRNHYYYEKIIIRLNVPPITLIFQRISDKGYIFCSV